MRKADAELWARQREGEIDRGGLPSDLLALRSTTLSDILERYRDTITTQKRGAAQERYKLRVLLRHPLARLSLDRLSASDIASYRDERLRAVKGDTVRRELAVLHHGLEIARREWGYDSLTNPMAGLKKPKAPEGRERRLQPGELEALTKVCGTITGSWLLDGIHLAIETGLRRGELLGIRWKHVNFATAVLHVPFTKTDKPRYIPLTDRAVEILAQRKASSTDTEYAFPISANAFRLAWERCKRRAEEAGCIGVQQLRFHDLRHEAVSRFFEKGLNTAEVASISGHRDLRMLFRYTHLRPEDLVAKLRSSNREIAA
jgi:integrase